MEDEPAPGADQPLKLSDQLEDWLTSSDAKTVGNLVDAFGPSSFAVLFVVFMAFPALPIPTGGISHVLEIITMLLALELIAGRREVWIPDRFANRELMGITNKKFQRALLRRIRWLEKFSRPRLARLVERRTVRMLYGLTVLGLTVTAFLSPPFSGLDTVPSLGVVVVSLGVLLRDVVIAFVGAAIGAAGVLLVIALGRAALSLI